MSHSVRKQINLHRKLEPIIDFDTFANIECVLKSLEMEDEIIRQRFDRDLFDRINMTSACLTAVLVICDQHRSQMMYLHPSSLLKHKKLSCLPKYSFPLHHTEL